MFSVIVPTFNRSKILSKCIEKLVTQNFPSSKFEILIIDNNSNDQTFEVSQEIIKSYPEHNIFYFKEHQQGLVYARHRGAKESNHEILVFTDDDAYWDNPSNLQVLFESFKLFPLIEGISGKIEILWDEQPDEWIYPYESYLGKIDLGPTPFIMKEVQMNGAHFVIRKSTLYKMHGFNPDQVFDHLVGDGESGLCYKLTQLNIPVLWQPNSIVKHFQVKSKNCTQADILRRLSNNGIATGYHLITKKTVQYQFIKIARSTNSYLVSFLKKYIKKILGKPFFSNQLQMSYDKALICYLLKYYLDKEFKRVISKEDWKLF